MLGWQIAVLVVMVVVFLVCFAVLTFLLLKYGRWGDAGAWRGGKAQKGPLVLHFRDFDNVPRSINLEENPSILNALSLYEKISQLCGVTDPETLALYSVEASEKEGASPAPPIAPDAFLKRDASFTERVQQTARLPLVLGRMYGFHRVGDAESSTPNAAMVQKQRLEHVVVDVGVAKHQGEQTGRVESTGGGGANRPSQALQRKKADEEDGGRGVDIVRHAQARRGPSPVPPPAVTTSCALEPSLSPFLLPTTHHISTKTPLSIHASMYYVCLDSGATRRLDAYATTAIDKVLLANQKGSDYTFAVPQQGKYAHREFHFAGSRITLRASQPGERDCVVTRRASDAIFFTFDKSMNAHWQRYTRPFYLPPGRWCVRARAQYDGEEGGSVSRVFAVELA